MINKKWKRQDILEDSIAYTFVDSMHRKPGELVQRLSEEKRAQLRDLKSDDIKDVRWPWSK
mgnify:CR=1 FL=1